MALNFHEANNSHPMRDLSVETTHEPPYRQPWDEPPIPQSFSARPSTHGDAPGLKAMGSSAPLFRAHDSSGTTEEAVTDWDGLNDTGNPKNWSLRARIYHTMLPALYGFSVSIGTSMYSPGVFAIEDEFHVSQSVSLLGLSLYALGLALGPVVGAPVSETQGRKAVYIVTLPLFLVFTAGAGATQNIQTLIICRFLSATFGSPALAVGAGTIADLWDMERGGGLATVLITCTFFLGPSLGPLVGGYTLDARGGDWRWLLWDSMLIAGPIGLLAIPSSETSKKIILARRAKKRGLPTPPKPPPAAALKMLFVVTLARPLQMLATEPIVLAWALYHSFVFGVLFAFFDSYPYIFITIYDFSAGEIDLAFLGIFIGILLAVVAFAIIDKTVYQKKKLACAPEKPPPEARLYTSMMGAFGVPIALFWLAWTAGPDFHFLAPIAAGVPFGWGTVTLFLGGMTYLLDTYGAMYGASAIAANGLCRYTFGAAFPMFTVQMYEKLGIGWAASLLAFIGLAMLPIPFVLYKFGPALRAKSTFR
ncbi:MFS multidrug transporter-like protein [Xylariomycetidae sp. FL0641]|nr:MFS multidrug transporter-like protein [Xylariomycetidae sp. FL0641]